MNYSTSLSSTKPIIALLGGPGSGKSAVAGDFAALGCGVIDADRLAREALDQPAVKQQLAAWWGKGRGGVLDEAGEVDRKTLAARVFDDPDQLARLENLVHPQVHARRAAMREAYLADPEVVAMVEDCPLLLEKNLQGPDDVLVYVEAPRQVRLARLAEHRGWDEAELAEREKHQWSLDIKRERADYVIDNGHQAASRKNQVGRVFSKIITLL